MSSDLRGIVLVLLAAGRSERFGVGKLGAMLAGETVLARTMHQLAPLPFAARIAVIAPGSALLDSYTCLPLDPPDAPQSRSLALGVAAAQATGARAAMIALADMPLVPTSHFAALASAFDGDRIASSHGDLRLPPAIFGSQHFPALMALSGDRGAGALLHDAPHFRLPPDAELDIDTPGDLARAEALLATTRIA
ncbi:nucleotidyltransferase family protein [Novosphingobium cyanobacteriorum]|uniref:Nucleotidyltransferase family protein n=1 Tax=Novosphingobium cyanobacteriorum TaxID=3024215 RepID=A0ABT6CLK6_9SPHN|nr:nucleotidyltransferase family protein [Novosphingobium cyanobacteriorum]MDF8334737.1 nucleotidyltransferase family protein [Novosphingobium cyanobacteriorum]